MSLSPLEFYQHLVAEGVDFFTGVPDSLLKEFCACIDDRVPEDRHIIAANEGNAIGIAAGYYLGTGKLPLVYMQNSGLGNAINPLLSLCDPEIYSIPLLLMVGWRGEPGQKDAVQHVKDGRIQTALLEALEVPYEIISREEQDVKGKLRGLIDQARTTERPVVLLVRKGTFGEYGAAPGLEAEELMTREEALRVILDQLPEDTLLVSTTGKTSREVYELREQKGLPHNQDFLTVGSMGHCSSIALGLALSNPDREVVCIDGDGALIMHMGSLATIGKLNPTNFKHILINNEVHESVGGQATAAGAIDIPGLVRSNGYRWVEAVHRRDQLLRALGQLVNAEGPAFLDVRVKPGSREDLGRPTLEPGENKRLFMDYLLPPKSG